MSSQVDMARSQQRYPRQLKPKPVVQCASRFRPNPDLFTVGTVLFALKKLIGAAVMPLSLVLLMQVIAVILLTRKKPRAAATASAFGVMLLIFASNEGIADRLIVPLETRYAPLTAITPGTPSQARFILVLGGGHNRATEQSASGRLSSGSLSRLVEAVRLARLLPEARLLLCGPTPDHSPESHASILARAAAELGVDSTRITLLPDGRDTHDEVLAAHQITGDATVLLVTSAWHMPRAMGLADKAGLHATAAPCDYTTSPIGNPSDAWLKWSVFGFERSTFAVREYLGLLWTRLRDQR